MKVAGEWNQILEFEKELKVTKSVKKFDFQGPGNFPPLVSPSLFCFAQSVHAFFKVCMHVSYIPKFKSSGYSHVHKRILFQNKSVTGF